MQMRERKILNVVATCGTAFTKEHAAVLKRYVQRLNFMFDADNAGRKAMQKSILLAVKEDMKATAYIFPEGHDPDSSTNPVVQLKNLKACPDLIF